MFQFIRKPEEEKKNTCCCGSVSEEEAVKAEERKTVGGIRVLGGGCAKCHELEANTKAALNQLGINEEVELITDFAVIAAYGVMTTPALVIDNKVVSYGKVLKTSEVIEVLKKARAYFAQCFTVL